MYASDGHLQGHREKVGKKDCPMKPRVRSYMYANTQVDKLRLVQRKKRAALLKKVTKSAIEGVELEYKLEVDEANRSNCGQTNSTTATRRVRRRGVSGPVRT